MAHPLLVRHRISLFCGALGLVRHRIAPPNYLWGQSTLFCGAPAWMRHRINLFCGAPDPVHHRIRSKVADPCVGVGPALILWRILIAVRHRIRLFCGAPWLVRHRSLFCGAPIKMRHRIRLFCGALLIGAPQIKLILWRSYAHAPQNMRGPHTHARVSHFGLYSVAQPCPCATE